MNVWEAIVALARRFYVTVPLIVLALVGGSLYLKTVAPEYHASASLVLIGPTAPAGPAAPAPANPYVRLGTIAMANTIQQEMTDSRTLGEVSGAGNSTNFTVAVQGRSPILVITTTANTRSRAVATANQLVSIIQRDVSSFQSAYGSDPAEQISTRVLSAGTLSPADLRSRQKARLIIDFALVLLAIICSLVIDTTLRRRGEDRRAVGEGRLVAASTTSAEPSV